MTSHVFHFFRVIACLFLMMVSMVSKSQNIQTATIFGTVSSSEGEALPMAIIRLDQLQKGITSNIKGYYTLKNIAYGTYSISVSFLGYTRVTKSILINDSSVSLDFVLQKDTHLLNEITVVHDATELKEAQGFAIESIKTTSLQGQSIELNSVLDQTAGIRVRQQGGLGSRVNYTMNGLGSRSIRFFLNGVPMDYFGSSFSINTLPISLIDRVEIYKGVVPVELGNDALGGAINLISKSNHKNTAEVSYSYGSFNTHRASVFGNWRDDKTGIALKLSTFYNYSDNNYWVWGKDIYVTNPETFEIERGLSVRRFHDAFESKAIKGDLGFTQKKWADQFFISLLYSDMDKDIQHGTTMDIPFGEATYHQKVVMPHLTYQKYDFLTKGLDLNIFSSYSTLTRSRTDSSKNIYNWHGSIDNTRTLGGEQSRTLNTLSEKALLTRINAVYHLNKNHKFGYNYVFNDLSRTDSDPLITQKTAGYWSPQTLQKHSMGLSFQSELFHQKLTTSLFAKRFGYSAQIKVSETAQGVTNYNTVLTYATSMGYGLAGSYKITPSLMLSLSLEKTARLPESDEILGDGLNIVSTSSLKPETSVNANVGFKLKLFEAKRNSIHLSGNAFYRDVSDLIQQYQNNPGSFVHINFDKVVMKGIDGKIQFLFKQYITVNQTFSFLHPIVTSDKDELGNENLAFNVRLPNTPFFQSNTQIRFNLKNIIQNKSKAFIYWSTSFVDEFHRYSEIFGKYNKDIIPAQWIHSCGVSYTFPKENLSLSFDLSNMFDHQVFDDYAIQKPGRAAYIKVTYRIM